MEIVLAIAPPLPVSKIIIVRRHRVQVGLFSHRHQHSMKKKRIVQYPDNPAFLSAPFHLAKQGVSLTAFRDISSHHGLWRQDRTTWPPCNVRRNGDGLRICDSGSHLGGST
eukprot:gb/GEZN01020844.1/.p1 GENE.gb/GEZN01020844.1/~~gb/GEZN01020844.1/.p1  ORF type:complete len:111 (-),score=0.79 gb/GEZN01020844.1/:251-583(-)